MTSVNQVILTGKVAKPPQFHHQPDGTPVLQFSLELNDSKNISLTTPGQSHHGQDSKRAGSYPGLIHIVAIGQLAQSGSEIRSGQRLLVKGRLHQRHWETPEGRYRSRTEVIASDLHSNEESEANSQDQK
ncbi:MAG: single-stranded DNA-binding protein [Thermodesulfobacteriota bacterium]|nr:single-stranded DNA-binding protein [Thermodesulfobacteriota bacterium]